MAANVFPPAPRGRVNWNCSFPHGVVIIQGMLWNRGTAGSVSRAASLERLSGALVVCLMTAVIGPHVCALPVDSVLMADDGTGLGTLVDERPPGPAEPQDPTDAVSAAAVEPAELARTLAALDSSQYAVREQAQASLVRIGGPAVTTLHKGAEGGSLERTSRAVRALGQIAAGGDLPTFERVQDALETLTKSKSRSVSRRAQLELEGLGEVRTRHAIARFEALGGRMKKSRSPIATQAAIANGVDFRPGPQAVLNRKWHGTDEDLVLLTRIANLETVYVTRSAPVSAEALEKVRRAITTAHPNRRFQIQPRGDAMVGIQAGTGEELCLISGVEEGSPAERAGLKPGDVITHYNGEQIDGFERLVEITRELAPGTKVTLEVIRREQVKSIDLELADFE